jgi:phosphohistidine swiveling domain-containing protein
MRGKEVQTKIKNTKKTIEGNTDTVVVLDLSGSDEDFVEDLEKEGACLDFDFDLTADCCNFEEED